MKNNSLEEIEEIGGDAFRSGESFFDNPFYRTENMPGKTGDPIKAWYTKIDAWHAGYQTSSTEKKAVAEFLLSRNSF